MTQDLSLTGVSISGSLWKKGDEWFTECMSHVQVLHQILSVLFEGLESDEDKEEASLDQQNLLPTSNYKTKKKGKQDVLQSSLFTLFSQHCYKLVKMFSEPTKGPVKLPVSSVMKVLTRCLKVSYIDVTALPSMSELASHILTLHQSCLDVLGQLILCCRRDVLSQGQPIIDMCLQTLHSACKMESAHKRCRTKASVYQVLLIWVETCGWGSSLTAHAKVLTQDLVSNTGIAVDFSMDSIPDVVLGKRKKGKRKKLNKGDSYAELGAESSAQDAMEMPPDELDVLVNSLSFASIAVENLPFSSSKHLIRHITDVAATLQRKGMDRPKPYHVVEIRKKLYQALVSCALVGLDSGSHRNNAISHFQLTNSALHLLIAAETSEEHEVKSLCGQALKKLELYGNVRCPVIRKVLPSDDNDTEDITDLTRERDRLVDETENLRARLLESELENEQQSRLIENMRKELAVISKEAAQQRMNFKSQEGKSLTSLDFQLADKEPSISSHNVDEATDDVSDDDDDNEEMTEVTRPDWAQENTTRTQEDIPKSKAASDHSLGAITETRQEANREVIVDGAGKDQSHSSKRKTSSSTVDESEEDSVKRVKIADQVDSIEDMLLDFVDAPPDS